MDFVRISGEIRRILKDQLPGMVSPMFFVVYHAGCMMIGCSAVLAYAVQYIQDVAWWALTILTLTALAILLCVVIIWRQPQNTNFITFKVSHDNIIHSVRQIPSLWSLFWAAT